MSFQLPTIPVGPVTLNFSLLTPEGRQACRPGDGVLVVGTWDGPVRLLDAATWNVRWEVEGAQNIGDMFLQAATMSSDGRFLASVRNIRNCWKLWDAASGSEWMSGAKHDGTGACMCGTHPTELHGGCPVVAHTGWILAVAFSPCGKRFATGGRDNVVILWDAHTGKAEHVLRQHTEGVSSVSFSADGARVASGAIDGAAHVWDSTTGALLRTILHEFSHTVSLNFAPTGRSLTVAGTTDSDRFHIFDVDSGERISSISGCTFAVHSPDGRTIATVNPVDKFEVHIVDAESGTVALRLGGHEDAVIVAAFSPDGSKLASGTIDIRVWSSLTGGLLKTIELESQVGGPVRSLAWGRDWAWDTHTAQIRGGAFAMGQHPRLGEDCDFLGLEPGVVQMILDRV